VKQNEKHLTISLHPFLHAYFTKGIVSRQVKWFLKYKKWVKLETDSSLALLEYHFRNKAGGEIELS
jgi:ribonuclease G